MRKQEAYEVIDFLSEIIGDLFITIGNQSDYIRQLEAENERLKRPRPAKPDESLSVSAQYPN